MPVKTCDGKAFYLISCGRHALHLHTSFCTYKEDFGIWTQAADGIGNGDGRKDMSTSSTTANDNSKFFIHRLFPHLVSAGIFFSVYNVPQK